jgi:putative transposase
LKGARRVREAAREDGPADAGWNRVPGRLHRPSTATLVTFITEHKDRFGVEPICTVLTGFGIKIAPSTYYAALTRPKSRREIEDEKLMTEIRRVYDENYRVYGAKKIWRQLRREGVQVGRGRAWPGVAGSRG